MTVTATEPVSTGHAMIDVDLDDLGMIDVDLDSIRIAICANEKPGIVGASFEFTAPFEFAEMTAAEARQIASAFTQAADDTERATP